MTCGLYEIDEISSANCAWTATDPKEVPRPNRSDATSDRSGPGTGPRPVLTLVKMRAYSAELTVKCCACCASNASSVGTDRVLFPPTSDASSLRTD